MRRHPRSFVISVIAVLLLLPHAGAFTVAQDADPSPSPEAVEIEATIAEALDEGHADLTRGPCLPCRRRATRA